MDQLVVLGIGILVFVSTNLDDIFLLLAFFSDPAFAPRQVIAGQYVGVAGLVAISLIGSLAALVVPSVYLGLLGIVPLWIGLRQLIASWKSQGESETEVEQNGRCKLGARPFVVSAVTMANGGDNIGVYVPLFSTSSAGEKAILVTTFLVLTGLWCAIGYWLASHRAVSKPIRRYGRRSLPWVLIGLGIYIVVQANIRPVFRLP